MRDKKTKNGTYLRTIKYNPDCPGGGRTFEYGYVRSRKQLNCIMLPQFEPHWWAQYLGDGTDATFKTKAECIAWIDSWNEIGDPDGDTGFLVMALWDESMIIRQRFDDPVRTDFIRLWPKWY